MREGLLVVGVPRSGTTLVRRLLDTHPNVACPGETALFGAAARFLRAERMAEGVDHGVVSGLSFVGFDADEVHRRLRELVFSFLRDHARSRGKRLWAEKTAFDVFHLPAIERLCGDAVGYLCVVRNGLDVAVSLDEMVRKNQRYPDEVHAYVVRDPRPLHAFARAWNDATLLLCDLVARRPDAAVLVRYEDLVADADREMSRALATFGETWSPEMRAAAMSGKEGLGLGDWKTYQKSDVDAASVGRWKSLSWHTVGELGEICNPGLERAGYPRVEVVADRTDADAKRRYEIAMMVNAMRRGG